MIFRRCARPWNNYTTIIDKVLRNPCRNPLKICSGSAIFFGSQIVVFRNLLVFSNSYRRFTVSISNELNWLPRTNRSSLNRTRKSPEIVPSGKQTQYNIFLLLFLNAFDVAFVGKREKRNGRQIILSNQSIKSKFFSGNISIFLLRRLNVNKCCL